MRDWPLLVRLASGAVFVAFGAAKFINHGAEVDSFETYGLPSADAFVYAVGVIEVVEGRCSCSVAVHVSPRWCWPATWPGQSWSPAWRRASQ